MEECLFSHKLQMLWIQAYATSVMAFLWTGPLNSGIPARISPADSHDTKQKCQPVGPDVRFETVQGQWLTHAVLPWIRVHGTACPRCEGWQ